LQALEDRTVPSTLMVTNLSDTGVAGDGSLRGEIAAAAPGDTIQFSPSLKGTLNLASDLALGTNLTLQGNLDASGNPLVTLSRGGADSSTDLSVAAGVTASVWDLGLSGATLHALVNQGALTLGHDTVSGNRIGYNSSGFGLNYFGTVDNTGALTVQDSTISNNQVNGVQGSGVEGGAGIFSTGTLTVLRTQLVNNLAQGLGVSPGATYGGGIYNYYGAATVTGCTLTGNQASLGGALFSTGTLTVGGSTFSGNSALVDGGGLYAGGTVQVTNCVVTGNTAPDVGGGMVFSSGTLTLSGSTLAGNQVGGSIYAGHGGGLFVNYRSKTVTLTDCTIANNTAVGYTYNGQLYPGAGGGVYVSTPPYRLAAPVMSVVSSTVAGNRTDGTGGGLWLGARVQTTLSSTLIALNTAAAAPDIAGALAAASSYNLVGNGTGSTGLINGSQGNQVGTSAAPINPRLGPLQNNGGPTPTMALLTGSLARGAGDPALLGTTDQRGVIRKGAVDVGAYQAS
jgi:predicted outer membrane repeat protein